MPAKSVYRKPHFCAEQRCEQAARDKELQRKLKLADEGANLMNEAFLKVGIEPPHEGGTSSLSYEELKELAYRERYGDLLGWSE